MRNKFVLAGALAALAAGTAAAQPPVTLRANRDQRGFIAPRMVQGLTGSRAGLRAEREERPGNVTYSRAMVVRFI